MKRSLIFLLATALFASKCQSALANGTSFGINISSVGVPLPVVPVVPVAPAPVVVLPPNLGVSFMMGGPYDLAYYNNYFYARQDGRWFCSTRSGGPWQPVTWRYLPEPVRYQYVPVREVRPVGYGDRQNYGRYQHRGQYQQTAWTHDNRERYEGYRIERGRDFARHDHDDRH